MSLLGKLSDALADNLADLVVLPIKMPAKTLDELWTNASVFCSKTTMTDQPNLRAYGYREIQPPDAMMGGAKIRLLSSWPERERQHKLALRKHRQRQRRRKTARRPVR